MIIDETQYMDLTYSETPIFPKVYESMGYIKDFRLERLYKEFGQIIDKLSIIMDGKKDSFKLAINYINSITIEELMILRSYDTTFEECDFAMMISPNIRFFKTKGDYDYRFIETLHQPFQEGYVRFDQQSNKEYISIFIGEKEFWNDDNYLLTFLYDFAEMYVQNFFYRNCNVPLNALGKTLNRAVVMHKYCITPSDVHFIGDYYLNIFKCLRLGVGIKNPKSFKEFREITLRPLESMIFANKLSSLWDLADKDDIEKTSAYDEVLLSIYSDLTK